MHSQRLFPSLLFGAWFLALNMMLPGDAAPPREGRDIALFFAIDKYDDWPNLNNPIKDAKTIAKELEKNFGFETEVVKNPTELEIFEKLNEYSRRDYAIDQQLLIFFSGHGHLIRSSKEGFIIPKDALGLDRDPYGRSFLAHDRLRNIIANMPCHHIMLIMDSCFSGTFDERIIRGEAAAPEEKKRLYPEDFEHRSLLYLTAGGDEYVEDGTDHSPFARAFLLALRNFGDLNGDGVITFLEMSAYIQSSVKGQRPTAGDFNEHMGGDFYFEKIEEKTSAGTRTPTDRGLMTAVPFTSVGGLSQSPNWSPDGKWIAYASDLSGNMDIWKKPANGGQEIRLTRLPSNESHPAWSPDGQFIAFSSDKDEGGISLIPAQGGEPRTLIPFGVNPQWSPDGRQLVFESSGNVFLADSSGQNFRILVEGTSASPHPVWTADGQNILFWNRTKGDIQAVNISSKEFKSLGLTPAGQEVSDLFLDYNNNRLLFSRGPFGGNKTLFMVALDEETFLPLEEPSVVSVTVTDDLGGTYSAECDCIAYTARTIERHLHIIPLDSVTGLAAGDPEAFTRYGKLNYYPAISHDDQKLVWTSHRTGNGALFTQKLDDPEVLKATANWSADVREIGGSFGLDNQRIFYSSTKGGSYQLWQVAAPGDTGVVITDTRNPIRDVHPNLSPDGKSLVFNSNRSGNWDIWLLPLEDGEAPRPLTNWPGNEIYPVWSPDNKQVAFQADPYDDPDLWVYNIETGKSFPIVAYPSNETWCAWSPDKKWFYFVSDRSGYFNIWKMPAEGGEAEPVTNFESPSRGLPDNGLYTKFAVGKNKLILTIEERRGDIFLLKKQ